MALWRASWIICGLSRVILTCTGASSRAHYGHLVAYSANSRNDEFELANEVAERFVFSLGLAPKIDVRSFSVDEHRVLLQKLRRELADTSDGISPKSGEPLECCFSKIFDEKSAMASISFVLPESGPSHCDREGLQVLGDFCVGSL